MSDFGLPNDQDSFGDLGKEKKREYKAFDWSDTSKFDHVRNTIIPGAGMQQQQMMGAQPLGTGTMHTSTQYTYPSGYTQGNMMYPTNAGPSAYTAQQGAMPLQMQSTYTGLQPGMTNMPGTGAPKVYNTPDVTHSSVYGTQSFPVTNSFAGPSATSGTGVLPSDSRHASNPTPTSFQQQQHQQQQQQQQPITHQSSFTSYGSQLPGTSFAQAGYVTPLNQPNTQTFTQPTTQTFNQPSSGFTPVSSFQPTPSTYNQPASTTTTYTQPTTTTGYNQPTTSFTQQPSTHTPFPQQPTTSYNQPTTFSQPSTAYNQPSFTQPQQYQQSGYNQSTSFTQTTYSQQTTSLQQTSYNQQVGPGPTFNTQGTTPMPSSYNLASQPVPLGAMPASTLTSTSSLAGPSSVGTLPASSMGAPSSTHTPTPVAGPSSTGVLNNNTFSAGQPGTVYTQPSYVQSSAQPSYTQPQPAVTPTPTSIPNPTPTPQQSSIPRIPPPHSNSFSGNSTPTQSRAATVPDTTGKAGSGTAPVTNFPTLAPPSSMPASLATMNFTPMMGAQMPAVNQPTTSPVIQSQPGHSSSQTNYLAGTSASNLLNGMKPQATASHSIPAPPGTANTFVPVYQQPTTPAPVPTPIPTHPPSPVQSSQPPATPPPTHNTSPSGSGSGSTTPSPRTSSGSNFVLPPPPSSSRQHPSVPRQSPSSLALNGNVAQAPPLALETTKEDDSFFKQMDRSQKGPHPQAHPQQAQPVPVLQPPPSPQQTHSQIPQVHIPPIQLQVPQVQLHVPQAQVQAPPAPITLPQVQLPVPHVPVQVTQVQKQVPQAQVQPQQPEGGFKADLDAFKRVAAAPSEEQWKPQNEAQLVREVEEKTRREIEERVRKELEEKHKAEVDLLRKQLEEQKQKERPVGLLTPPNRPRSRSHGADFPPSLFAGTPTKQLPEVPVPSTEESFFPQNFDFAPPIQVSAPPPVHAVAAPSSVLKPPPRAGSSRFGGPPSPSLTADAAAPERRARVKTDLENILGAGKKPLPIAPAPTGPRGIPIPNLSSVSCPICNEQFPNERAVSVHIDDAHPVQGAHHSLPSKSVTFGANTFISLAESGNMLSMSPLQKSRSAESLGDLVNVDPLFGLDDFNPRSQSPAPRSASKKDVHQEAPAKKEETPVKKEESSKFGKISLTFKGRSKPTEEKSQPKIVDIGEMFNAPGLSKAVAQKKEGLNAFNSLTKKGRSLTGPEKVQEIAAADFMTGSPRPPSRNQNNDINKAVLKPTPKRERKPYTQDSAAAKIQATYRAWVYARQYKKHLFRAKVIRELVTTEHTYVESLEKMVQTFAVPLRQSVESGKPLCSAEDISNMFSKLEEVLTVNKVLCEKLTLRVMKWNIVSKISDIFAEALSTPCNGLDFKKVYNDCTLSYNLMLETLDKCRKEKTAFKQFITNGEKSFWGQAGNSIQAFFILPVQRITRYILLFKEAIRHTQPKHPDYEQMKAVLVEMELMCTDVNENQRREDMEKNRVQTLQNIANKIEPKLKDLVVDGRVLLREGVFSQFDPEDDQIKERYYFLFNDIMLITREQRKKYLMRVHITLNNVRLKDINDNQNFLGHVITNAFEMHTPSMSLMFMLPTAEDKESVYKGICDIVNKLKEQANE